MTNERIERIRERAHRIWEEEGCPAGRDTEHWERATREIDSEDAEASENSKPAGGAGGGQGLATGLQGGGSAPGGGPGASAGSIGTGGGSSTGRSTGAAKRRAGKGTPSGS